MRSLTRIVLLGIVALGSGCFATRHTVGDGPHGGEVGVYRVWYAGYGFIPMSRLDSRSVVGAADHYRVETSFRASDVLLNIFVGPLGFFRQTTLVEK